jgi:type IV pilus assembly protein PilN
MIRINLLPVRKKKQRNTAILQLGLMAGFLVLALIGCYAWTAYYDTEIEKRQAKIAEAREEIKRLKKIIGEVNQLEQQKERLRKQLGVIEKLERGKRGPVHVLDELSTHIPKRVWIKNFREQRGTLDLDGTGLENADISEFLRSLQKSKYFSDVRLSFTQSKKKNGVTIYDFAISATVNYSA